ncbi:PREDICTED: putative late blight resistance protein homolog R1B-16 [Ipomoea nil]|uniref:putative late blight resistance protein homolog R1B-16 n=1 Tax=Ipomoea nil TaxID=35883 RepID=UPI000901077D|nr:PREDICTED: putative late blight resistance protein homolog R1B-16 [Ipomoea nil]
MACVAVNSLIRTLELEFLQPEPRPILQQMELIPLNKELIQSLQANLGFLIQLFDEFRMDGVEAIKELETKLRDVAFGVEDEIEFFVVDLYKEGDDEMGQGDTEARKTQHSHRLSHVLQQAIEDIDAIKEEVEKVMMEYKHDIAAQGRKTTLDVIPKSDDEVAKMAGSGSGSSNHASHTEDIMVGKDNEFEIIRKMLIQHPSIERNVVSIQGMGGIGKTTLARRVYENQSIVSHFDKRLWVVVSQHHNKRQMLIGLLGSKDDDLHNSSDDDLALRLYQSLKGQRYLVVMDDVWSIESWNDVKSCFPDDVNGSRVLLTTRVAEVATCIGSTNYFSHQLQFLDQGESWDLFRKKACKSHGVEFEIIGRPIVEICKGLPLAIVVVAGVFPEDYTIGANNLARLWAAEGLLKAFKNESYEAVAKREGQNQSLLHVVDESGSNFPQKGVRWIRVSVEDFDISGLLRVLYIHQFHWRSPTVHIHLRYLSIYKVIYRLPPRYCDQDSLTKVPYLKKRICGIPEDMAQIINNILLLKNIRKLKFDFMKFKKSEWKEINVLSKLPRLEVLKLGVDELGKKWEVPENVKFCHLVCLKISYGNLKYWEVGAHNFPKLERLCLYDCSELREIPNSFAEIPTLNLIELEMCHPSAVMSAKQIQAEQHDYGNENMVVIEIDTTQLEEDDSDEGEFDEDDSHEGEFDEVEE